MLLYNGVWDEETYTDVDGDGQYDVAEATAMAMSHNLLQTLMEMAILMIQMSLIQLLLVSLMEIQSLIQLMKIEMVMVYLIHMNSWL